MNGGTYSEALKVGFTPEQAGFLGRMGAETRQEAVESFKAEQRQKAVDRQNYIAGRGMVAIAVLAVFLVGVFVGKAIAQ